MSKSNMTDEEMERILRECQQKHKKVEEDESNRKEEIDEEGESDGVLCKFGLKVIDKAFDILEHSQNPLIRIPVDHHEKRWEKIYAYIDVHHTSPYLLNALFLLKRMALAGIALGIILIITEFIISQEIDGELLGYCVDIFLFFMGIYLLMILIPGTNMLVFFDTVTGKQVRRENVELKVLRFYSLLPADAYRDSLLDFFFLEESPYPCYYYYAPLEEGHKAKSSKGKKPPHFYEDEFHPQGKEKKKVRFIMTEEKSNLIDKLVELEPTMEFEICYLRFSHILKEIRPITGYESAAGVEEILDKINKIYP